MLLAVSLIAAPHALGWGLPPVSASAETQAACQKLRDLFGGDVFTGKYKGSFSAAFTATDARVPGLTFSVALTGELEVDVGEDVKSLTGTSTYKIKGRIPGLAQVGGAFNLNAGASGDLSLQSNAKQRFVAETTNNAYGSLLGQVGDIVKELSVGGSEDDAITFTVANSDCRAADGTFSARIFDSIHAAFAAKGLAVNDTGPPMWHVDQADPDLEQKISDFRDHLQGISTANRGLNILTAAADELKSRFDEDHRACGAAVMLEWISSFLPGWIDEASRDLSDALDAMTEAAEAGDQAGVKAGYKRFQDLAGEVSVYALFAGALGISSGPADQANALAESVLDRYISNYVHWGQPREAVRMLTDVAALVSVGKMCAGADPLEVYARLLGHFTEQATEFFASLVDTLQQDPTTPLDAASTATVARLLSDEDWVSHTYRDVPRALNDYCDGTVQC